MASPGFVSAIALQRRLGKPLDVALLECLKQEMSIYEIAEEWCLNRATVRSMIDYLGYRQYMAKVPRRVRNSSAWIHRQ